MEPHQLRINNLINRIKQISLLEYECHNCMNLESCLHDAEAEILNLQELIQRQEIQNTQLQEQNTYLQEQIMKYTRGEGI